MSDGQTETNEMIAAQNAAVSVRLERGEAVKWHDGEQWQTGVVLNEPPLIIFPGFCLVQTCEGIYVVVRDALEPYPPRCEACGGEGTINEWLPEAHAWVQNTCPECAGSGRVGGRRR